MGKGERTRRNIVGHALQTASRDGFAGLSIGGLARDLGLSKSGLFAHFNSKEQLQLEVLETAEARFVEFVVRPALREARGEARVRALFDCWLAWATTQGPEGGCVFVSASAEFDDREGPIRDRLVESQRAWTGTLARAASIARDEGHFGADLDAEQFAFEAYGILLGYHLYRRLMEHPLAEERTRHALDALIDRSRAAAPRPGQHLD